MSLGQSHSLWQRVFKGARTCVHTRKHTQWSGQRGPKFETDIKTQKQGLDTR